MFAWQNSISQMNARRAARREKAKECPICGERSTRVSPERSTREHCEYLWEIGESGEQLGLRSIPGILDDNSE